MRLHTSLHLSDLQIAAKEARVDMMITEHGSRSRDRAFEVKLTGESRRRPNGGNYGADGEAHAATWDQWGVFLAYLFARDESMTCWAYKGADEFHAKTAYRFDTEGFPEDYHGDHTFRYNGTPRQQECNKCSAVQRW